MKINWDNVNTNIMAIYIYVDQVYPNLTIDQIIDAFHSGTLFKSVAGLAVMYYLHRIGQRQPKTIHYVMPEGK